MAEPAGLRCRHCVQEFANQSQLDAHYEQHAAIQARTGHQRVYGHSYMSHNRRPQQGTVVTSPLPIEQPHVALGQIGSRSNSTAPVPLDGLQNKKENDQNESNERLASISNFINRENGLAVFRRFSELNIHNLLYMQTQLVRLENQLMILNSATTPPRDVAGSSSPGSAATHEDDREKVMTLVSEKLKEYNKALLLQSQLRKLEAPERRSLTTLRDWATDSNLIGYPECQFIPENDLIALTSNADRKVWVYRVVEAIIWKFLAKSPKHGRIAQFDNSGVLYSYDDEAVLKVVRLVLTFLSSILLVVPIIILYFVKDGPNPLIVVTICTVAVAVIIALTTDCKNHEILTASAAYSAVMIVYVSH